MKIADFARMTIGTTSRTKVTLCNWRTHVEETVSVKELLTNDDAYDSIRDKEIDGWDYINNTICLYYI